MRRWIACLCLCLAAAPAAAALAQATERAAAAPAPPATVTLPAPVAADVDASRPADAPAVPPLAALDLPLVPTTRSGREIYRRFREGLADPSCAAESSSPRWRRHYAAAPRRMADGSDDVLALFGYVVDALREADLPTEYALIPFVESGYKPAARSPLGPAGMWQMIRMTARAHHVPMHAGYDGRLSPVESTRAAVRYLKTLHGMFAGDWRLAVMAYNAGEYRVFDALRRSRQVARDADPERLTSLSGITRAYVRKLHALSCLFDAADERAQWLDALDRQVPVLETVALPAQVRELRAWAVANGRDPARVARLNPAYAHGRIGPRERERDVLVPALAPALLAAGDGATAPAPSVPDVAGAAAAAPVAAGPDPAAQAH